MNSLTTQPAGVSKEKLAEKISSIKQGTLKLIQKVNKKPEHLFLEQVKQAAPRVSLVDLIASNLLQNKTWRPRLAMQLNNRHALNKVNTVDALLYKTEIIKSTPL